MDLSGQHINQCWASLLIEELIRQGCDFFAMSPGSRSTPLALAVANNPRAKHVMHYDERGTAFLALGHARATGRPAAIICTSGSAVANLWPAVVEAEASRVPLILLTADRPPELLHTGANQAIDQEGIFGKYTRWAVTLPCPTVEIPARYVISTAAQAVHSATGSSAGPVHLNCMFREPLAPTSGKAAPAEYCDDIRVWMNSAESFCPSAKPLHAPTEDTLAAAIKLLAGARRGLLVAGQLRNAQERESAARLAQALQWPLLADITSGLRNLPLAQNIHHYDQLLLSKSGSTMLQADVVLQIGARITSKRLNQHLERMIDAEQCSLVQILDDPSRQDPAHRVRHRVEGSITHTADALRAAFHGSAMPSQYAQLSAASARVSELIDRWSSRQTLPTEIGLARSLSRLMPAEGTLFLGNSMPVRDMDMYAAPDASAFNLTANRGASGIDGNIATAAGLARGTQAPAAAIIGDLAALHDVNSLTLLGGLAAPFALIVINNDGGGIFSFLPVAQEQAHFEQCFGTPHGMNFRHAARQFKLGYAFPETPAGLEEAFNTAMRAKEPTLIEVWTNRAENLRQHRELQEEIRKSLDDV